MKKILYLVLMATFLLSVSTGVFATNAGDEAKARSEAENYIKSSGISEISVISKTEQSSNITLDEKYYPSVSINYSKQLTTPAAYNESPEMYTFIALDNGKPATHLSVKKDDTGSFSVAFAGGDPSELVQKYEDFGKICDDKNYVMLDAIYEQYMFGTVDGKEVVMPLSAGVSSFDSLLEKHPEYYSKEHDAVLIPKDTFNDLLQYVHAHFKDENVGGTMGGSLVNKIVYMNEANTQTLILTICIISGGVIVLAAAAVITIVLLKKKKRQSAQM